MIHRSCRWEPAVLVLILVLAACGPSAAEQHAAEPEKQESDSSRLDEALVEAGSIRNIKSLLVWQGGAMVAERYFNDTEPDELHDVRSVTKSFLSSLVGIAIEQGHIGGVDDPIVDHLGPVAEELPPAWRKLRIRDLLTMTAGHDWAELGVASEFIRWFRSEDQLDYILEKPIQDPPGKRFNYSDGSAHLMSVVLSEATGVSTKEYARDSLFKPLGIGKRPWLEDNRGYNYGGVGLQITARDMIAFGVLYLRRGIHEGKQVVPAKWVDASVQMQVPTRDAIPLGQEYGYYWWIGRRGEYELFFATGFGGQFIVVVPDLDLVVTATSDWRRAGFRAKSQWSEIFVAIVARVVPAMQPEAKAPDEAGAPPY